MLSRALEGLELSVPEAAPMTRRLMRVAGRIVIDTGRAGASAETWPNTEEMALLWIDEALRELGYEVRPTPGGDRPELGALRFRLDPTRALMRAVFPGAGSLTARLFAEPS